MNFFRLLILALAIWLAYRVIKHYLGRPKPPAPQADSTSAPDMVRCEQCGLHVPKLEAVRDGDQFYCGKQHLEDSKKRTDQS
jgi:uncharacterized protein